MGRGADALERLRKALIAQEEAQQDVQKAIYDIKQMGGEVMATQDDNDETPETAEQIRGRRLFGCQRAISDAEPLLTFAGAYDRVVTSADVSASKTVGELVSDLLNAKYDEIAAGDAD